jgi:hypothetical protein
LLVQRMGLWWVALVFKPNRKPIKGDPKVARVFWRQIYRRVSKVMQGKSDKIHEHPHSLCEPCTKATSQIFWLESDETFGGIFEEPLLSWGRSWTVFLNNFFLFIVRLLGISELFYQTSAASGFLFLFIFCSPAAQVLCEVSFPSN